MIIYLKNKHSLKIGDFLFDCCVGKGGISYKKIEGDKRTPKGLYDIGDLYFRKDKIKKFFTKLKRKKIKKNMGWCDDVLNKKYNKMIKIKKNIKHEKLFRADNKYDLLIPIKYNFNKTKKGLGSCIFIHLTQNYKPTNGCIALKKKDFLIMLKLIDKRTKISIY